MFLLGALLVSAVLCCAVLFSDRLPAGGQRRTRHAIFQTGTTASGEKNKIKKNNKKNKALCQRVMMASLMMLLGQWAMGHGNAMQGVEKSDNSQSAACCRPAFGKLLLGGVYVFCRVLRPVSRLGQISHFFSPKGAAYVMMVALYMRAAQSSYRSPALCNLRGPRLP